MAAQPLAPLRSIPLDSSVGSNLIAGFIGGAVTFLLQSRFDSPVKLAAVCVLLTLGFLLAVGLWRSPLLPRLVRAGIIVLAVVLALAGVGSRHGFNTLVLLCEWLQAPITDEVGFNMVAWFHALSPLLSCVLIYALLTVFQVPSKSELELFFYLYIRRVSRGEPPEVAAQRVASELKLARYKVKLILKSGILACAEPQGS